MSFSDETLIAYMVGELDDATRHAVEDAMRRDSSIARRVARLRAARDGVFAEPAAMRSQQAKVVQLAAVRAQRVATQQAARKAVRRQLGWREWSALGAVLVVGLAVGKFGLAHWQPAFLADPAKAPTTVISRNGMLVAQGRLDTVLSQQMGGAAPSEGDVRVGLSFLSNEGGYCRTFTVVGLSQDLVGVACRASAEWRIPVMVQSVRPSAQMTATRMAGTEMPAAVLEAIDQRIVGGMLDTRAELEALRRNWQR
ncbi:hypothetical protein NHH73_25455 [Oxalobacteraceae bacterium OTU3CINTB1]|nr:hypothetical protein NHH73_25455 [Oxalobacteraceae bacterium OTU3CINTB1]